MATKMAKFVYSRIGQLEKWLFFAFLATFFLGIRKVLFYRSIGGMFNEYLGSYLYLSDLLLLILLAISSGRYILKNKNNLLSIVLAYYQRFMHRLKWLSRAKNEKMAHLGVKKSDNVSLIVRAFANNPVRHYFLLGSLLIGWSFLSIACSGSYDIAIYRSIKFLELFLLIVYVIARIVPRGTILIEKSRPEQIQLILLINRYLKACLFGLILIGMADHYLWDIWQGQLLFGLVLALVLSTNLISEKLVFGKADLLRLQNVPRGTNIGQKNKENVPRGTNIAKIYRLMLEVCSIIVFGGVLNAILAFLQFIFQKSIGLRILGESVIAANISGVAKIVIHKEILVRSYGFLPHPNILGGFLFVSIIVTLLLHKLFHLPCRQSGVEQFNNQCSSNCSTWNNSEINSSNNVQPASPAGMRGTIWFGIIKIGLVIQIVGLICTFSKSAILAVIVVLVFMYVPRGTNLKLKAKKLFHVEQLKAYILIVVFLMIGSFFLRTDICGIFVQSIKERGLYYSVSERIISESPIIGVGTGQYIVASEKLFPSLEIWQYQPVHNIFLLIWSEWGIVGLVLFILFLWKLFHMPIHKIDLRSDI